MYVVRRVKLGYHNHVLGRVLVLAVFNISILLTEHLRRQAMLESGLLIFLSNVDSLHQHQIQNQYQRYETLTTDVVYFNNTCQSWSLENDSFLNTCLLILSVLIVDNKRLG